MSGGTGGSKKQGAKSGMCTMPFSSVSMFQSDSLMNSESPYPPSLSFASDLDLLFLPDLTSIAMAFLPSDMMKSISSLPSEVAK